MMTHDDLLSQLTKRLGWAEPNMKKVLDAFIDTVRQELIAGNRVDISDFGLFQPRKQSEYILIDSETEERYLMPPLIEIVFEDAIFSDSNMPQDSLHFHPDESLENEVNGAFAFFEPTPINEGVQFSGLTEVRTGETVEEGDSLVSKEIDPEIVPDPEIVFETESVSELEPDPDPEDKIINREETEVISEIETVLVDGLSDSQQDIPIKQRTIRKKNSIWVPVLGGMAIALAVFFFKVPTKGKTWKKKS